MRSSILLLCVALVLLCLSFAACGGRDVQENTLHAEIQSPVGLL